MMIFRCCRCGAAAIDSNLCPDCIVMVMGDAPRWFTATAVAVCLAAVVAAAAILVAA